MSKTKKDRKIVLTDDASAFDRREFLQLAGVGTAGMFTQKFTPAAGVELPKARAGSPAHVVVIGAGAWGGWTALNLRKAGIKVTLVDQYGPANSRATSADETRGIRSSYGDRAEATAPQWVKWARTSIARWHEFDAEWAPVFRTRFFMETGDVICRAADEPFIKNTRALWTAQGVKHEVLNGEEVRKRWPQMNSDDTTIAIYEPDAGVARARASTLAVAAIAEKMGATIRIGRVRPGPVVNNKMDGVVFDDGSVLRADAYVWACGPWLRKIFQPLMTNRARIPMGYVCYFATPAGDTRFTYPNLPSFNFPGVTGWVALPVDNRGFRVRGAIAAPPPPGSAPTTPPAGAAATTPPPGSATGAATPPAGRAGGAGAGGQAAGGGRQGGGGQQQPQDPAQNDPDLSSRWMSQERIDGSRRFVARRFPDLKDAPLSETRACHYESSVNRNFIIDHVPGCDNAWIAGLGQSEGFKFGPVLGEYIAMRVLGTPGDPELVKAFKMPTEEYET